MKPSKTADAASTSPARRWRMLFLFPLLWSGYSSVKGSRGRARPSGFGFGNYQAMARYGEGLATYLTNTAIVSGLTVLGTRRRVRARRLRLRPLHASPARTCCSWRRWRS